MFCASIFSSSAHLTVNFLCEILILETLNAVFTLVIWWNQLSTQFLFAFFSSKFMFLSSFRWVVLISRRFFPLRDVLFMTNELRWLIRSLIYNRNFGYWANVVQVLKRNHPCSVLLTCLAWGWRSYRWYVPMTCLA